MSKWSVRLFIISLVAVLAAGTLFAQDNSAQKKDEKAPRLTLVEPTKDFGTVPKGQKLTWAFLLKNTGTADLEITNVQPSCGCTVAKFDKLIKPGETGKVTATVDTTNFAGPISKSVTIFSNDPDARTAQISIHAIVRPYVEAYPAGFVRYLLLQGQSGTKYLTLYSEEEAPFQIVGVETPGDWCQVAYRKLDEKERVKAGRPGQNQYMLKITVGGPTAPIGPLVDKIKVTTNSKHQPIYRISLSGLIRPGYNVAPNVLNFGEVPASQTNTRIIKLSTNRQDDPAAFKIQKIESSDTKLFTAESKETEPGRYQVTVTLGKDVKPGDLRGELKIYTTDEGSPVKAIPVMATIRG